MCLCVLFVWPALFFMHCNCKLHTTLLTSYRARHTRLLSELTLMLAAETDKTNMEFMEGTWTSMLCTILMLEFSMPPSSIVNADIQHTFASYRNPYIAMANAMIFTCSLNISMSFCSSRQPCIRISPADWNGVIVDLKSRCKQQTLHCGVQQQLIAVQFVLIQNSCSHPFHI